jgi:hypothetical protein
MTFMDAPEYVMTSVMSLLIIYFFTNQNILHQLFPFIQLKLLIVV